MKKLLFLSLALISAVQASPQYSAAEQERINAAKRKAAVSPAVYQDQPYQGYNDFTDGVVGD